MEVTVEQNYKFTRKFLEQIASNSPVAALGGKLASKIKKAALAELCSMLAKKVLFLHDVAFENAWACMDEVRDKMPVV